MNFGDYLIENGYYFDKVLIENFLLSLKVKPFVIFTGNSGTGKTKLSQMFSKYHEGYYIKFNFASSVFDHNRFSMVKQYVNEAFPIALCQQKNIDISIDGIKGTAKIDLILYMDYGGESEQNIEKLKKYFNKFYIKGETILLKMDLDSLKNFISKDGLINESFSHEYELKDTFKDKRQLNLGPEFFKHVPFSESEAKLIIDFEEYDVILDPFAKLTYSPNDEFKTYFERDDIDHVTLNIDTSDLKFDKFEPNWSSLKLNTYELIPVGANWTDNTNIIGFYNSLFNEPHFTPSYNLIKDAYKNKNIPYFLILDEMNLSHVERYFADILSAIESGEPIPVTGCEKGLEISENLSIVGTVNIDETTYMFSPKVLDRANTIEFPSMSVKDYLHKKDEGYTFKNEKYLLNPLSDIDLRYKSIDELKAYLDNINVGDEKLGDLLIEELDNFQKILMDVGFEFGFRVINEILRFMVVASKYEKVDTVWDDKAWQRYFDAQIKQKILPKLHGSKNELEKVLNSLFSLCLIESENFEIAKSFEVSKDNCKYYESAVKIQKMSKTLSRQRYVSFIN